MRNFIGTWKVELGLVLVLLGVAVFGPAAVRAECVPGDVMHIHDGADHCDSGLNGCYNVCG